MAFVYFVCFVVPLFTLRLLRVFIEFCFVANGVPVGAVADFFVGGCSAGRA